MKQNKFADIEILSHGHINSNTRVNLDPTILPTHLDKITFLKGDACNLDDTISGQFDIVLACNLLCRVPQPKKFLNDVMKYLHKDSVLLLISPYSWLEEYTEKKEWIGGHDSLRSDAALFETISSINPSLTLIHEQNIPFIIREHERKFQLGVSHAMVWLQN